MPHSKPLYTSNILSFISFTVLKFHDGSGGLEGGLSDNRVPDSAAAAGEGSSGYAYTTSCLVKGNPDYSIACALSLLDVSSITRHSDLKCKGRDPVPDLGLITIRVTSPDEQLQ